MKTLDAFTRAYITTALWSSSDHPYGECPCCGELRILSHFPEEEFDQVPMCDNPGCGVTPNENPPPLDRNYTVDDIAPAALERIIAECKRFQRENAGTIDAAIETGEVRYGPDFCVMGQAGHDFWLTRNRHGAGFWDGDWPEPYARTLTDAAHTFGECTLYVGDDGKLYI